MSEETIESKTTTEECADQEGASYDWSRFERSVIVNADLDKVYQAWATSGGLESWFLETALYTAPDGTDRGANEPYQAGDAYRWTWFGYDGEELNKVLEANGTDRIVFGFAQVCTVAVDLRKTDRGVEVKVSQSDIPLTEDAKVNWHMGCSIGWVKYLMNLRSMMEGGPDLRDKE